MLATASETVEGESTKVREDAWGAARAGRQAARIQLCNSPHGTPHTNS